MIGAYVGTEMLPLPADYARRGRHGEHMGEHTGEHRAGTQGTYLFVFYELTAFLTSAMLVPVRRTIWLSEAPALRIR